MKKVLLGRTNIEATCQSFGALPIQRTEVSEAVKILQRAYEGGINFYDTARAYTDSEEKIGKAFTPSMRQNIFIATKSTKKDKEGFLADIQISLKNMNTDYVDILQAHNIGDVLDPNDENGAHAALLEAKKRGYCRFIGITSHRLPVAEASVDCGLYDTVQFPMSYLSNDIDLALIDRAKEKNIGLLAMKALAGGAITSGKAAAAFMATKPSLLPLWGVQHMHELEEFLSFAENPPEMTEEIAAIIEKYRIELSGNFCRACGYCMPCTASPGLALNDAMRMNLNLRRAPAAKFISESYQQQMLTIEDCIDCGVCKTRCPYGLDIPTQIRQNLKDYRAIAAEHGIIL